MTNNRNLIPVVLLVVGAKGAIGSTIAVVLETAKRDPQAVKPYLTSLSLFPDIAAIENGNDSRKKKCLPG